MRKLLWGLLGATILALLGLPLTGLVAQTTQCGGSFVPSLNCIISGQWNYTKVDPVSALPVPFQVDGTEASGVVSEVTTLTNAQILALNATPVTVVAAPGQGKYIDVISVNLVFNYTAAYTVGASDNLRLYWISRWSGNAASAVIETDGFLTATADTALRAGGVPDNELAPTTNQPVVIQNTSGVAFGGGDAANDVKVVVNYRIVTTSL